MLSLLWAAGFFFAGQPILCVGDMTQTNLVNLVFVCLFASSRGIQRIFFFFQTMYTIFGMIFNFWNTNYLKTFLNTYCITAAILVCVKLKRIWNFSSEVMYQDTENVLSSACRACQIRQNVGRQQIYSDTENKDKNHYKIIKVIYYGIFEPDGSTSL